jgi:hypothetical protein
VRLRPIFYTSLVLLAPVFLQAGSVTLVTGTPGDGVTSPATLPSPNLGGLLLNFSDLSTNASCQGGAVTSCPAFNPATYASQGVNISSPDGIVVYPFSVQSGPNELFDNSTDGSANVTIALSHGAGAIGVGIADSDDLNTVDGNSLFTPVTITLQALGFGGVDLGSAFTVTTPETDLDTAFNGYWVVEDNSPDIFGLQISAPATGEGGLAIADVQVSPEPSTFLLLFVGSAIMAIGAYRLRRKI